MKTYVKPIIVSAILRYSRGSMLKPYIPMGRSNSMEESIAIAYVVGTCFPCDLERARRELGDFFSWMLAYIQDNPYAVSYQVHLDILRIDQVSCLKWCSVFGTGGSSPCLIKSLKRSRLNVLCASQNEAQQGGHSAGRPTDHLDDLIYEHTTKSGCLASFRNLLEGPA